MLKNISGDCFRHCCRTNRNITRDNERRKKKEEGKKRKAENWSMRDKEIEEKGEAM